MKMKPVSRKQNIVVQEIENELLVYDLQTNRVVCLNETSAMIYQLCDGKRTIAEISDLMSENLKTPVPKDMIWLALDSFKKENLLEESKSFAIDFNGLSRRQVIKKIGLASMIALPLISSVVAPSAAMAASAPAVNCSVTPLAPGCQIPFSVSSTSPCSVLNPSSLNGSCNFLRGSQCSSGMAIYQSGSCVTFPGSPPGTLYNCVCA